MTNDVAALQACQDQDMENALRWWTTATNEDKKRVWDAIQRTYPTAVQEVVSRFAQIGYTAIALEAEKRKVQS